jgi:hypothetical protein
MMNQSILQAQVTSKHLRSFAEALEDLCQRLPENPRLNAVIAEAPLDQIIRFCQELDQHLEQLKQVPTVSASTA